jgi:hypothetical protein
LLERSSSRRYILLNFRAGFLHETERIAGWFTCGAARGSRKEQLEMAESKVQKVARQGAARKSVGTCQCGGELIWAQVVMSRPRMMKVCEKCGTFHEKAQ